MSTTPSIPTPQPTTKDPPPPRPSSTTSTSPPINRRPSLLNNPRQPSYSSSPTSQNYIPQAGTAPSSKSRPSINTRTTSFDPNPQVFSPSPIIPDLEIEQPSQTLSASQSHQDIAQGGSASAGSKHRSFAPVFTLVNDVGGGSGEGEKTFHPSRVHYIFSDDEESDVLTASLLQSLREAEQASENAEDKEVLSRESLDHSSSSHPPTTGTTSSSSSATFRKPSTNTKARKDKDAKNRGEKQKQREERVIIVDLNANLDGIEKISSLSSEWQVLSAALEHAPSFDPYTGAEGEDKGLMLKISGVGVEALRREEKEKRLEGLGLGGMKGSGTGSAHGTRASGEAVMGEEEMNKLLESFDRKMGVLRGVLDAAGSRGVEEQGGRRGSTGIGE